MCRQDSTTRWRHRPPIEYMHLIFFVPWCVQMCRQDSTARWRHRPRIALDCVASLPRGRIMQNNLSSLLHQTLPPLSNGTTHAFTGSTQRLGIREMVTPSIGFQEQLGPYTKFFFQHFFQHIRFLCHQTAG